MALNEDQFLAGVNAIANTAFDSAAWSDVLGLLAKAANGQFGQVMGIHPKFGFQFHFADIPEELSRAFEMRGGGDPSINPRARILSRPYFQVDIDRTLATEQELKGNAFLHFAHSVESVDVCGTNMPAINSVMLCAVVSRTRRHKPLEAADVKSFSALLPHLYNAIGMRSFLEQQGALIAAGALDAVACPAFVVDSTHKVVSMTQAARAMLQEGRFLALRQGGLESHDKKANEKLQAALRLACARHPPPGLPCQTMVPMRSQGHDFAVASITPIPAKYSDLRFGPAAIVAFERTRPQPATSRLLGDLFGLTGAEADIAIALAGGDATADIAQRRRSSVATVRTQIKNILHKTGAPNRLALMRKLAAFTSPE